MLKKQSTFTVKKALMGAGTLAMSGMLLGGVALAEELPDEVEPSAISQVMGDEDHDQNNEIGFDTEEAAIEAAEQALEDNPNLLDYEIVEGNDEKFRFVGHFEELDIEEDNEIGFATEEAAIEAAEQALKDNPNLVDYKIVQGEDEKFRFVGHFDELEEEVIENNVDGFLTEAGAIEAAEQALEDNPNLADYEIVEGEDGKFRFVGHFSELEESEEDITERQEDNYQNNSDGFDTEAEAIEAAEQALRDNDNLKDYQIIQGEDGKFRFVGFFNELDEAEDKEAIQADEKEAQQGDGAAQVEKTAYVESGEKLPETGDVSTAVFALPALLGGLGLVNPFRRRK